MSELFALFELFVGFPAWLRNCIYAFTALSLAGIGVAFSPVVALIVAIGVLFLVVALGIYGYILKRRRDARQAALGGELQQNTLATPAAINDPGRKARLEDLRKRFQEGLEKYRAVGKDLYKLPWYVVVGEPAAGKSEAIRRCDVGFPPGMQDDFQGVGGTINMNWWFTNHAVILDTAGRLLFEEVAPGTTGEWKEFLGLLRKNRPNCPINGLLLVIPADSLVKDSPERIAERAGWIAKQLDNIQRELDVRFPVYVVISKCDLLNGFREFFEHVENPEAQRQMLGWSNPEAIDTPFAPELVEQHLRSVVERLRRRSLKLLEDPVPKDPAHRRTDEVDRLYAFPNSLTLVGPALSRYLSKIFVPGEWSAKPLFLRGIYFTSSLREGSELDQELAQAIGVAVDKLPSGRVWERETSFFLRDVFIEKIFREWGLVTRATDTKRMLRRRKFTLFGFGTLALAGLLLFSWFGYKTMKDSIGRQSGYWLRASEGWTPGNEWLPIVAQTGGNYVYNGDKPVGQGTGNATRNLFDGAGKNLVEFHKVLRDFAESQLHISWVFRPLYQIMGNLDSERRSAQRIVLEGSVVKPLVQAARDKISATPPAADPTLEANALLGLVRIEAGIIKRRAHLAGNIAQPDAILGPLQSYVVGQECVPTLVEVSDWTYSKGDGAGKWPGDWLTGGDTLASGKPGYNRAIDLGITHFRNSAVQSLAASEAQWKLIVELVDVLKHQFAPREQDLFQGASNQGSVLQLDPLLETPYKELEKANAVLDEKIQAATKAGLFKNGPVSLGAACDLVTTDRKNQQARIKAVLDGLLAETLSAQTPVNPPPLIKETRDRLNAILAETQGGLEGLDVAELGKLDETFLADSAGHGPAYAYRFGLYTKCIGVVRQEPPFGNLVGSDWAPLEKLIGDLSQARREIVAYEGGYKNECGSLCAYWLGYAERHQIDECCKAYLAQANDAVGAILRFPVIWPPENTPLTGEEVRKAAKLVAAIHRDLHSRTFGEIQAESRLPIEKLDRHLAVLDPVLRGLVSPSGSLTTLAISMPAGPPRAQPVNPDPTVRMTLPAIPVVAYDLRSGVPSRRDRENLGGQGKIPLDEERSFIHKLPVDEAFHFHRYDPDAHQVFCGNDWSALRLLTKAVAVPAFGQDGCNWQIKIDDLHPDVVLNFLFDHPLPELSKWPTREAVLPED